MTHGLMVSAWIGAVALSVAGCGDDGTSSTDTGGPTEGDGGTTLPSTDSGGSTVGATQTSAVDDTAGGSSAGEESSGGGDVMVVCGDGQVCAAGQVCVEEVFDPPCQDYDPKFERCPEDTVPTQCGGAGIPCCCGPADPSVFTCLTPSACTEAPSCDCLGDICSGEKVCQEVGSATGGTFRCETPPAP